MERDPEAVIRQALRAQAGGSRRATGDAGDTAPVGGPAARFSTAQVVLLAAIVGLLIGMSAGFVVLLAR